MNYTPTQQKKFHDFNHKNIALIGAVFAVLAIFMVAQGNVFSPVTKLGFTLGKYTSVFATAPAASKGAVLGASTLSPDVESQLSGVPITDTYQDTVGAANIYAAQVQTVVSADSGNPAKLAQDLTPIAVPKTLEEYQRLIVVRAEYQAQLSAANVNQQAQIQANITAISQQVQTQVSNMASQGVTLPS
jgi:hypothetical protein